jgi:CheY-like chemotaxis protein
MTVCAISPISTRQAEKNRPNILCVDDSQEILEICQKMLEAVGYQVFTAKTGEGALRLLHAHAMDAAVIDCMMPGMQGPDLAREIKSAASNVLVVMFSGVLHGDETFPCVDACLPKGKGPLALRKLLDSLLQM